MIHLKKRPLVIGFTCLLAFVLFSGMTPVKNDFPFNAKPCFVFSSTAAGHTDALLLTCMDYRLLDDEAYYMHNHSKKVEDYDQVILAGASLGVTNTTYPNWGQTFWQHLQTAIDLHDIHRVIIIDHRNCGAYKLFLKKDFPPDANEAQLKDETAVHKEQMDALAKAIHEKYAGMEITSLLMGLDGLVEEIGEIKGIETPGEKH